MPDATPTHLHVEMPAGSTERKEMSQIPIRGPQDAAQINPFFSALRQHRRVARKPALMYFRVLF